MSQAMRGLQGLPREIRFVLPEHHDPKSRGGAEKVGALEPYLPLSNVREEPLIHAWPSKYGKIPCAIGYEEPLHVLYATDSER